MSNNRKKRLVDTKDTAIIKENISNTSYSVEDKKRLELATMRLNEELEARQISQKELSSISGVSTGAISKYTSGKGFISVEYLPIFAKILNVSTDYLLGVSNVKNYTNNELNKRFGLNDNSIKMLDLAFQKPSLNTMFDNDLDSINYLLEEIKNYSEDVYKYKNLKDNTAKQILIVEAKQKINYSRFRLQQAFLDLIDEHLKK